MDDSNTLNCNREVICCERTAGIREIALLMRRHHVGSIVVVDGLRPLGIVTDRDLVVHVLAADIALDSITAADLIPRQLETVSSQASLHEAIDTMHRAAIRRLPVVDREGRLFGIISANDVARQLGSDLYLLSQVGERSRQREPESYAAIA